MANLIEYRHLIQSGRGTAAIYTRTSGGSGSTTYVHTDHLGSPELLTGSSGNVLVRPSFSAYGERRDGSHWDGPPSSGDLSTIANFTRRGFTGHEHLDAVGLIHMNGRVYEPVAGRFLSADPLARLGLTAPAGQYTYALNNPLRFIDPSGFCDEDPATGSLINCDLDEVPVRGAHWDECDWGGPWMAGWGEFCRGWHAFWDHDPFARFDNQPQAGGGGGSGSGSDQTSNSSSEDKARENDDNQFSFCKRSENPRVFTLGWMLDIQFVFLPGFGGGTSVGVTSNGQFFLQFAAQGELGGVLNLSTGLQGTIGRNIGDLPVFEPVTDEFIGVQGAVGAGPVVSGGWTRSVSGNTFTTDVGRLGGGLAGQVAMVAGTTTTIALNNPLCD